MGAPAKRTSEAATRAASVDQARAAAGTRSEPGGPGTADPFVGELRRGGLLPLLVLHLVADAPSYGNQLMDRISRLTAGTLAVNPNTMYPLLRSLEAKGLVAGRWEHPERRSRRFYAITDAGRMERERLLGQIAPRLDAIAEAVDLIRREVLGATGGGGG